MNARKLALMRVFMVVRPEGFEPPAFRIGICCYIQT